MNSPLTLVCLLFCASGMLFSKAAIAVVQEPDKTDDAEIKWPHCVLNIEDLKPRSLADAVAQFNNDSRTSPIGVSERPITDMEVITAIETSLARKHVSEKVKAVLSEIKDSGNLPGNAYFRRFTRFDDGEKFHGVWWVRLVIETDDPPIYSVPVRTKTIFSRPYTQMERQQNAQDGVTLINRFSSYYEELPKQKTSEALPKEETDRLVKVVSEALKEQDVEKLKEQFVWVETDNSIQGFVETELQSLVKTKIHSISVSPRKLDGNLIHWSAFQHYEPNLTVIGYLDIVHDASDGSGRRVTLSLELGKQDKNLRLVNYIAKGEPKFPKKLAGGLTMSGKFEPLPDSTHLLTTLIINPGLLISAHLANEEVWQRGLNVKKQPLTDDELNYNIEDEESDRLKALFKKLRVKPVLQPSSHARDLPELYKADPDNVGRYVSRDGILTISYNIGIKREEGAEFIWLKYLPHASRYYIVHRPHWADPYHDRVFGLFKGNPYERLPEIEEDLWDKMKAGNTNLQFIVNRMMKMDDADLTERVVKLFDKGMNELDFELTARNELYRWIAETLKEGNEQLDAMPIRDTVVSLRNQLDAFFDEIEKLRIEHPPESYSSPSESRIKVPAEIADDLWGEPVNGLRAAMVPETTRFELHKTSLATLVVENVSEHDIRFSIINQHKLIFPSVTYKKRHINLDYNFSTFPHLSITEYYRLKPGEKIAIAQSRLRPFRKDAVLADSAPLTDYGLAKIPLTAAMIEFGGLRADYQMHLGKRDLWRRGEDGSLKIFSPAKGEWTGTLETNGFEIPLKTD